MAVSAAATHFDAIVLGAGQAGPPLAVELANAGHKVALIPTVLEDLEPLEGT
jgi:pyruvate/2-oxoglutarate dehydrogenase complex dihydrolipoamide dehydrogenase (E3) component